MIPYLPPTPIEFPPADQALTDPDGLLAAGGELNSAWLMSAYAQGIFPWFNESPILWWSPKERPIIRPETLRINQSLQRTIQKNEDQLTLNKAFRSVIKACAQPRKVDGETCEETWITRDMVKAYIKLHEEGHAHSVELWRGERLVGGIYGVQVGGCFFGESMFSRVSDASKLCFVALAQQFFRAGGQLIDCQMESNHMTRLGAQTVSRAEFLKAVNNYGKLSCSMGKADQALTIE